MEPTPWQQSRTLLGQSRWLSHFLAIQDFPIQTWIFSLYKSLISPLKPLCFLGIFYSKLPFSTKNIQEHRPGPSAPTVSGRRREDNTTVRATLAALAPRLTKCQTPWSGRGMLWEASSRTQACAPVCATQPKITSSTWRTQHVYTHHISYIIYGYIYDYIGVWSKLFHLHMVIFGG